jgi:hypothetical protein
MHNIRWDDVKSFWVRTKQGPNFATLKTWQAKILLVFGLLLKLANLSHLACQIFDYFVAQLSAVKSLTWQILVTNQAGPKKQKG